jgi:hypothetical protein
VSILKTPREKKLASLALDCRNAYGENAKSSRKNIPLRKKLSRKAARRISHQTLDEVVLSIDQDSMDNAEADHRSQVLAAERGRFQKWADAPLGKVLQKRQTGRWP